VRKEIQDQVLTPGYIGYFSDRSNPPQADHNKILGRDTPLSVQEMVSSVFFRDKRRGQGTDTLEDLVTRIDELVDTIDRAKDNASWSHLILIVIHLDLALPGDAVEDLFLIIVGVRITGIARVHGTAAEVHHGRTQIPGRCQMFDYPLVGRTDMIPFHVVFMDIVLCHCLYLLCVFGSCAALEIGRAAEMVYTL
jgi:hypothetical protein